jgi:hypothetical protein
MCIARNVVEEIYDDIWNAQKRWEIELINGEMFTNCAMM